MRPRCGVDVMAEVSAHETCPCCGQQWFPGRSKLDAKRLIYGLEIQSQTFRLAEFLVDHFGEAVPTSRLVSVLYHDDSDGGPLTAGNVVAVRLSGLRKKLAPYGLLIEGRAWRGIRMKWAVGTPDGAAGRK